MNTAAMMEHKAITSIIPKIRDKKKLAIIGTGVFLGLIAFAACWMSSSSPEQFSGTVRQGSDRADLSRPRERTGYSVTGTVTVNRQFPLGVGCVVAYDLSRSQAIAYSALDKHGVFKLRDVPPTPLLLLVKKDITDDSNPVYQTMVSELGIESKSEAKFIKPKSGGPMKQAGPSQTSIGPTEYQPVKAPKFLLNQPSKESLLKVSFEVSSPEFENLPEVRWMIKVAFEKYGHFSDKHEFLVPPGEGERVFIMDLNVLP